VVVLILLLLFGVAIALFLKNKNEEPKHPDEQPATKKKEPLKEPLKK